MKQTFQYGTYSYEYFIEFAERKTLALEVLPDLRIIVKAPINATLSEIEGFLTRKWKWLEKQLSELRNLKKGRSKKDYVSGESFYYLGRQYLMLVESAPVDTVKLERGKLRVYTKKSPRSSEHNKKLVTEWYDYHRDRIFKREYKTALKLFDYTTMPQLGQRSMPKRWGSYTADNKVLLNPRLIEAPREAIRYVCVHELCHKISRKHDKKFYTELDKRLPNWRRIKQSLEIRHG